jgi:hypothetical protein
MEGHPHPTLYDQDQVPRQRGPVRKRSANRVTAGFCRVGGKYDNAPDLDPELSVSGQADPDPVPDPNFFSEMQNFFVKMVRFSLDYKHFSKNKKIYSTQINEITVPYLF